MKLEFLKNNKSLTSEAVLVVSLLILFFTAVKVAAFAVSTIRVPYQINKVDLTAAGNDKTSDSIPDNIKKKSEELKTKNMFAPPAAKPKPPVCTGIFGNSAIINGKTYNVGDKVQGAEIIAVGSTDITIMWEQKEMKIAPFAVSNFDASKKPEKKPEQAPQQAQPPQQPPTVVQPPTQGRGFGPPNMSEEERRRMRERFRNMSDEERQRMREQFRNMSPEERRRFREQGPMRGGRPGGRRRRNQN